MTEQTSLLEAQHHNFSQFTMQDLLDPDQFRAKVRWAMFQPYFEERRQRKPYQTSRRIRQVLDQKNRPETEKNFISVLYTLGPR